MEIINTGELKRIDYERTEMTAVSEIFRDIYGVGECTTVLGHVVLTSHRASTGYEVVQSRFKNPG